MTTVFHLTSKKNIESILEDGIFPKKDTGLSLQASEWVNSIYPDDPTYIWTESKDRAIERIKKAGYLDYIDDPVLIEVKLAHDMEMLPDLPSFISDTEAYITDDKDGFWWQYGKVPFGLEEYTDEDDNEIIYFDDMMDRECLILASIDAIGSAIVYEPILPDAIVGFDELENKNKSNFAKKTNLSIKA